MVAKIIERLKYSFELWNWERQKRKEGFQKWFEIIEDITEEDVAKFDEIQANLKKIIQVIEDLKEIENEYSPHHTSG